MDVAFTIAQNGRLTFARNSQGDFYLDERAVYAVFSTLYAHKGEYLFDATVGTYLHTIKQDNRVTGTRLAGAATDALDQVRRLEGLITDTSATTERLRTGAWTLPMRWRTPSGEVRETRSI